MSNDTLAPADSKLMKEIIDGFDYAVDAVDRAVQADHNRQMENARKTGGNVSFKNDRIIHGDLMEQAQQSVSIARDDALKVIGKARNEARSILTDAPTDEEARYIVAVQGRDDMTREEVEAALARYKGHSAQHAIRAAAKRSGLKDIGITTEAERRIEMLDALNDRIGRDFNYYAIVGSDRKAKPAVIKANYELMFKSMSAEPSLEEWSKKVFGDRFSPAE